MGKYIKLFNTVLEYLAYTSDKSKFILPNLSLIEENMSVLYNPYVAASEGSTDSGSGSGSGSEGEGGSSEPTLEGAKILCKYNVEDTSNLATLYYQKSGSGSGSGSGEAVPMFSSMEVDGMEQEVTNVYTFDTTGEHTVLFTLPEGVTSIGEYAFYNCRLTSVIIGNSVTSIGECAFDSCYDLTSVIIGNSVTSIGNHAFQECSRLTNINIPDLVTSIGNYAFYGCFSFTSITIPDSVTSIGNNAFDGCSGLTSITIPDLVTSIGGYAFNGCTGLTSITIPDLVTSIGMYAFAGCSGLISVTIDNSVTSIGDGVFASCSGLTSITIPDSVTSIGNYAFSGCTGLTSITIPDSVTSIGNYAFHNCSGLTSVTINSNSIVSKTYTNQSSIKNIFGVQVTEYIIGNGVTSIGSYAFNGCSDLTNITCNATSAPTITKNTFKDIKSSGTLTVPAGSTGYDVWMETGYYYLGYYNWTKVEQ